MGPACHLGLTSALLAGACYTGNHVSSEVIIASIVGGVLIDSDKVFEFYHDKVKRYSPDITARSRVLHSILGFPFGIGLSCLVASFLPLYAVLLHMIADSSIPGLTYAGKHYCTHPPLKWAMFPYPASWWYRIVSKGWPVKYPAEPNLFYKIAEPVGAIATFLSIILFLN